MSLRRSFLSKSPRIFSRITYLYNHAFLLNTYIIIIYNLLLSYIFLIIIITLISEFKRLVSIFHFYTLIPRFFISNHRSFFSYLYTTNYIPQPIFLISLVYVCPLPIHTLRNMNFNIDNIIKTLLEFDDKQVII